MADKLSEKLRGGKILGRDFGAVPLANPRDIIHDSRDANKRLDWDGSKATGGYVQDPTPSKSNTTTTASLSGPAPSPGKRGAAGSAPRTDNTETPPPPQDHVERTKPKLPPRKLTPDEMKALADKWLADIKAEEARSLAAGPSVGKVVPAMGTPAQGTYDRYDPQMGYTPPQAVQARDPGRVPQKPVVVPSGGRGGAIRVEAAATGGGTPVFDQAESLGDRAGKAVVRYSPAVQKEAQAIVEKLGEIKTSTNRKANAFMDEHPGAYGVYNAWRDSQMVQDARRQQWWDEKSRKMAKGLYGSMKPTDGGELP